VAADRRYQNRSLGPQPAVTSPAKVDGCPSPNYTASFDAQQPDYSPLIFESTSASLLDLLDLTSSHRLNRRHPCVTPPRMHASLDELRPPLCASCTTIPPESVFVRDDFPNPQSSAAFMFARLRIAVKMFYCRLIILR